MGYWIVSEGSMSGELAHHPCTIGRSADGRYCPTIKHVMLLLSLLTHQINDDTGPQHLNRRPGLVILWNIAGSLMEVNEANENIQNENAVGVGEPRLKFKKG